MNEQGAHRIIDRPGRQTTRQRLLFGSMTVLFWALWLYLWLPVLAWAYYNLARFRGSRRRKQVPIASGSAASERYGIAQERHGVAGHPLPVRHNSTRWPVCADAATAATQRDKLGGTPDLGPIADRLRSLLPLSALCGVQA